MRLSKTKTHAAANAKHRTISGGTFTPRPEWPRPFWTRDESFPAAVRARRRAANKAARASRRANRSSR